MNSTTNTVRTVQALISGVHVELTIRADDPEADALATTLEERMMTPLYHEATIRRGFDAFDREHTVTHRHRARRSIGPATLDTLDLREPLPATAFPYPCSNYDEGAA